VGDIFVVHPVQELRLGLGRTRRLIRELELAFARRLANNDGVTSPNKLLALAAELEQLRGLDEWAAVSWRHRLEAAERSSGRHDRCVDLIGITNFCVGLVLLANYIINL
jgi:hypothetical protein